MCQHGTLFQNQLRINEARNKLDYSAANKFFINEEVGGESGEDSKQGEAHISYSYEY